MGRGPHLCFLHGFCENQTIWKNLVEKLSENYTCTSIDLPGFGFSADLKFGSIPEVVVQIRELFKKLDIINPILIGHSMGGYLVAEYIKQFGDEINAAAFVHSSTRADNVLKKQNREKVINFVLKNGGAKFFPSFVDGLVADRNREKYQTELLNLVQNTPDSSIIDALNAMKNREDRLDALSQFGKPTLFIMGAEDNHYSSEEIYHQASRCKLSQIDIIENVGHLSMFEN
ncbi:MAG: alpha/beta hydrolase, partial [Bacteroidia bacterium]|nr:alpha/beta hydrolase [Bacteroidia bacterium]